MDQLIEAIVLPDAWMDRVLAKMRITDEIERLENERISVQRRLKRLGQVYLDNLSITRNACRQKRILEARLSSLRCLESIRQRPPGRWLRTCRSFGARRTWGRGERCW
jgi:hypothetical protein